LQRPEKKELFFDFMKYDRNIPRYVMEKDITVLIANYFDEQYYERGIVKKNYICGHIGTPENGTVFCDMCHITDKKGRKLKAQSFPMSLLPPSPGAKNGRSGSGSTYYDANKWAEIRASRNDKKYQLKLELK